MDTASSVASPEELAELADLLLLRKDTDGKQAAIP
jgi:hypothetical protein